MRMRRKAWARPELEASDLFIIDPTEKKGNWKNVYKNSENPLHLELGAGKGTFIAILAAENQDVNYIAIDIKDEVIVEAKRNIEASYKERGIENIDNVKVMSQEVALIDKAIGDGDVIERIYINFCNPWPKDRHKKRRLTHIRKLEMYKQFLKKGSEIRFKTDDDDLFEESLEYFKEAGLEIKYITYDLHNSDFKGNITTEHEDMFSAKGIKIKFIILGY
ncbi:tRNA (guanosine(46)-N7)-methyltransferase TrmB [uncultured Clostridium sp.]|uniref:tRNA (guanosine(46)-N7)-methyltransferase TrmB n=1 Tax=uncultured Clostridium sp. TaxID=59620 RepID=UPI002601DD31|nr:tRNA (guanosine(46)-N7)-methyltransferase TrmB [uncultured Clostridium sp.]